MDICWMIIINFIFLCGVISIKKMVFGVWVNVNNSVHVFVF